MKDKIILELTVKQAKIVQVALAEAEYKLGERRKQCFREGRHILSETYSDNESEVAMVLDQLGLALKEVE